MVMTERDREHKRIAVFIFLCLFSFLPFVAEPSYYAFATVQPNCVIASITPQCGRHVICVQGPAVGSALIWTPVILLNSPYGGSASGSTTTTTQVTIRIASGNPNYGGALVEVSSTNSITSNISVRNGAAGGSFELDNWTFYQANTVWAGGDGQDNPCTQPYVAKKTAYAGYTFNYKFFNEGNTTDVNEPTSITYKGHNSFVFHNGWDTTRPADGSIADCNLAYTYSVTTTNAATEGISYSFPGTNIVSGTLTMSTSSSNTYTYNFPANGLWNIQYLGSPMGNTALAFYFVSNNGC